jgi:uncharacterized protein with gpF-like domain
MTARAALPRAVRAAPHGRPHARKPKAPAPPSHAARVARGPKPPDAVVAAFRAVLETELADYFRAEGIGPARADASFKASKRLRAAASRAAKGVARAARRGVVQAIPRLAADIPAAVPAARVAGFAETLLAAVVESITKAVESGNPGRALESAAGVAQDLAQRESSEQVRELSQGAGVGSYTWTSELDRVVRAGHAALEGTIQTWDDPPITDDNGYRAHPGEPKNCRCVAWPFDPGA